LQIYNRWWHGTHAFNFPSAVWHPSTYYIYIYIFIWVIYGPPRGWLLVATAAAQQQQRTNVRTNGKQAWKWKKHSSSSLEGSHCLSCAALYSLAF
jgi:hypothetical protein